MNKQWFQELVLFAPFGLGACAMQHTATANGKAVVGLMIGVAMVLILSLVGGSKPKH